MGSTSVNMNYNVKEIVKVLRSEGFDSDDIIYLFLQSKEFDPCKGSLSMLYTVLNQLPPA